MSNTQLDKRVLNEQAIVRFQQAQQFLANAQLERAHAILIELIYDYPNNGELHLALGQLYLKIEEFDKAISYLSDACQFLPARFDPLFALIDAFDSVNSHQDVITLIDFMLSLFKQQPEVLYKAALHLTEYGKLDQARTLAAECLIILQKNKSEKRQLTAYTWLLLVRIDSHKHNQASIHALTNLLEEAAGTEPVSDQQTEMVIQYSLGEIYHALDMPQEAFARWHKANKIQHAGASFTTHELSAFFKKIKAAPIIKYPRSHAKAGEAKSVNTIRPIFIVGLPRTGSSLLEVLLCSHTQIGGLGEQPLIANKVAAYLEYIYKTDFPEVISQLNMQNEQTIKHLRSAAEGYFSAIRRRQITQMYVVDKLPANFQSIGLIKAVFPQAIIIHLTRAFEDVALSIFRHHFASNEPYFCDLKELSTYTGLYNDLMQHWSQHFGDDIYELRYEDLVSHPEEAMRKLLQHCGLPFELACTQTPEVSNKSTFLSPIKTLSAVQARQAMSKSAIGRAFVYRDFLKVL